MNITQQDRMLAERIGKAIANRNYTGCIVNIDEVASLLAEAREAQHKASWLPIDTAPKDGTHILLYRPSVGEWTKVSIGDWEDDKYAKKPRPYWSSCYERILGILWCRSNAPTHWMPLPIPPITNEGE